jgi:hypothetical protein
MLSTLLRAFDFFFSTFTNSDFVEFNTDLASKNFLNSFVRLSLVWGGFLCLLGVNLNLGRMDAVVTLIGRYQLEAVVGISLRAGFLGEVVVVGF